MLIVDNELMRIGGITPDLWVYQLVINYDRFSCYYLSSYYIYSYDDDDDDELIKERVDEGKKS